jgi:hypothetical protein
MTLENIRNGLNQLKSDQLAFESLIHRMHRIRKQYCKPSGEGNMKIARTLRHTANRAWLQRTVIERFQEEVLMLIPSGVLEPNNYLDVLSKIEESLANISEYANHLENICLNPEEVSSHPQVESLEILGDTWIWIPDCV